MKNNTFPCIMWNSCFYVDKVDVSLLHVKMFSKETVLSDGINEHSKLLKEWDYVS